MCSPVKTAMTQEQSQPMSPATRENLKNVNVTSQNFASELRSFFALCLMNLVFGSLAMAFGLQFIVTSVLAMAESGTFEWFPVFQVLLGWAAAVVGFRWILSSAKILKGVTKIRREYRAMGGTGTGAIRKGPVSGEAPRGATSGETRAEPLSGAIRKEAVTSGTGTEPVSAEALTGLIVRMMAHYRENWKAIWRMNLISTLGGAVFLTLGLLNLLQGISAWLSAGGIVSLLLAIVAAGINLTIGVVSLLFSSWFRRYARAWDRRLIEASHTEEALKHVMEQG
jgi:hypothetical protein